MHRFQQHTENRQETIVLNRPLQLLIPLELSTSENVDTIEKAKTNRYKVLLKNIVILHRMKIEIEDKRSKSLGARNTNIINKLMFKQ